MKKSLVVIVAVLAGGLAFAAWKGLIPPKRGNGTEATIGGAHRYEASQISDKDVTLQDPAVQAGHPQLPAGAERVAVQLPRGR